MTISLSDVANTCVAFFDEKVRSVKGCVPKDTFFLSFNSPVSNSIGSLRGHLQGHITSMISDDLRGSSTGQVLSLLPNSYEFESS